MSLELVRSQLNDRANDFPFYSRATAGVDCNVATTSLAIELNTGAKLSAETIREVANMPDGPTGHVLAGRAFRWAGMIPQTDFRQLYMEDVQVARELLAAGWLVCLFVDYGVIQDRAPWLTGDRRYRGAHAVLLGDWWSGQLGRSVHVSDPTFDGRTRGDWTAPAGVQPAKFSLYRDAAASYAGGVGLIDGWASSQWQTLSAL